MLHSLAGFKTQKSRTNCSFVNTGVSRLTTVASDWWDRNRPIILNLDAGRFLFQQRYYLCENVYYSGTSITKSSVKRTIFFSTPVIVKFRVIPHLFQRLFLISWENRRDCHITMPLSLKTVEVQIKRGHWNKRFRTVQVYWKFKAIWKMSFLTNEPATKAEINILTAREQGFGTRPGHHR